MDHLDDESLLALLPRRSDDEPPNLRQDLLDEVRDYMQSAWDEEQRQTPDPHEAWQLVLQRFGDPAKLVRKLWFDALKEQIMSRRMILAALGLAVVMFAVFSGLVWQTSAALQASAKSAREANLLLAEKLQTLGEELKALKSAPDLTWRRVRLRLKAEDGSEVRGTVKIFGMPFGTRGAEPLDSLKFPIEPNGLVDPGLLHVGSYDIEVLLENGFRSLMPRVVIQPGRDFEQTLVCPVVREPQEARVQLKYELPALAEASGELWLALRLEEVGREIDSRLWQVPAQQRWGRSLLVNPAGKTWAVDPYGQADGEEYSAEWRIVQKAIGSPVVIENLDRQVWNGIVPAGVTCKVISTELLILDAHETGSSTWQFKLCASEEAGIVFADAPDSRAHRTVELQATSADQEPYRWYVPVDAEAVDGHLRSLECLTTEEIEAIRREQQTPQPAGFMGGRGGGGGGFF